MLGYVLDEIFAGHRAPAGHPERGARADAVRDALGAAGLDFGAGQVIGIEKLKKYIRIAENRIVSG